MIHNPSKYLSLPHLLAIRERGYTNIERYDDKAFKRYCPQQVDKRIEELKAARGSVTMTYDQKSEWQEYIEQLRKKNPSK